MKFQYPAIKVQQTELDKPIILFGASALEIEKWAGVPQKRKFEQGAETTGFQREFNRKRLEDLRQFFSDPENIIQNPLLCSKRLTSGGSVTFIPSDAVVSDIDHFQSGVVEILIKDFENVKLVDILQDLRKQLETRIPELSNTQPPKQLMDVLKQSIGLVEAESFDNSDDISESDADSEESDQDLEGVLFEESHVADFWAHVAARHEILKELGDSYDKDTILGFSRVAMIAFLKPVVLVDGQHRLEGSLEALKVQLESESYIDEVHAMLEDHEPEEITEILRKKHSRRLPISLLLTDSAAEQVFQFVVVNQKATPIGKPLLGTIVSTTLTNSEMSQVAERLRNAGIDLEEAQAITWLARNPESPFCGKVERGLTSDARDLMQWTVLGGLVRMFRELSGGVLFGQANDYAAIWRNKYLEDSQLVSNFATLGFQNPAEYWSSLDGPWRAVFCRFFTNIRCTFGDETDSEKPNFWGKPRSSNLFNKISLSILSADFFQSLHEMKKTIDSIEQIDELVKLWLEDVNSGYFNRDWKLSGVKKDSVGIRNQWAQLWYEYRKNPASLPDYRAYKKVRQV